MPPERLRHSGCCHALRRAPWRTQPPGWPVNLTVGSASATRVAWTAVKGTHCVLRLDTRNGALPRVPDGE